MRALSYSTETLIRRAPEDVFDYCSDLGSELQWNPNAKYVEQLTDGPVGVGTRYRARWSNSGPTAVEVVRFDRPRSWETYATARGMGVRFRGTVTDAAPGARYTAYLELHPKGLAWLLAPLALLAMRRQDQQNMQRIREALESTTVTSD
jgi:Polyketide cyclase / dehydrase and lipid transport